MITKLNFQDQSITSYAIRKLTPRECFRLMGVREHVIDTMQSTVTQAKKRVNGWSGRGKDNDMAISMAQQYKQSGNSIVVDVLAAIYEQLWYPHGAAPTPSLSHENDKQKVFLTTFSGYDSQLMAADALVEKHPDFSWTCVGWSDIDKYACQMHNLVFPQFADCALGDVTTIDWQKVKARLNGTEVDMFTYSSPCQDISHAGKQMGLQEGSGTRSALLWYVQDAIEILRPKYLLMENVATLVGKKFMPDFQKWLDRLEQLGYVNHWTRLNAKDYGIPQNRNRVFCLSMRKDVAFDYRFPEPVELKRHLADLLEDEVAERVWLNDDALGKFLKANNKKQAVFVQFDMPPTHEDAMFLKTWLTLWMESNQGWKRNPTELSHQISKAQMEYYPLYRSWKETGILPNEMFSNLFHANMKNGLE